MKKALLLIDVQNDFMPGGNLAVPEGDQIIPIISQLIEAPFFLKVATQDYHPANHLSFASQHSGKKPGECVELHGLQQILWPDHCVEGSKGAALSHAIDWSSVDAIFTKGTKRELDSYSAFFDNNHIHETGLDKFLKDKAVTDLYVAGLATDYCVKYSVLDALNLGYRVFVITDACRAVCLDQDDEKLALEEMKKAGATLITSRSILVSH